QAVISASAHALCRSGPAATWPTNALDDQPARLCMEFDFFRQVGFVEERLGDSDPPRIADPDDARLRGHCDYSVATSSRPSQVPGSPRRHGHVTPDGRENELSSGNSLFKPKDALR